MKYLVHCTAVASPTFRHGNYRGEPRWELNSVDALLAMGRTVHSTTNIWQSSSPRPENLYDMNLNWMDESIQISYGVPHEIHTGYYPPEANPKYRIVQYHDGPSQQTKDKFLRFHKDRPGSIVATCSFKTGSYLSRLQSVLGAENVEWHFGPTVPCVYEDHHSFNQNTLLWAYRNFCRFADENPSGMERLFNKVADWMNKNHELKVVILAQPHNEISKAALDGNRPAWFFNFGFSRPLKKFADRVEILTNQHWCDVLDLYSKTKVVISPAEPLGGPPFEAASYGIPMILESRTNPFIEGNGNPMFNGLISVAQGFSNDFFNYLDRLFHDQSFYNNHGNAYRSFVKQHATYASWVSNVESIVQKRGWK